MAITPKDALGNKPDELKKKVEHHEKKIDAVLSLNFNGRNTVSYSISYSEDEWVVGQLVKKYEKAGWRVEHNKYAGDYREYGGGASSATMTFSPKAPLLPEDV